MIAAPAAFLLYFGVVLFVAMKLADLLAAKARRTDAETELMQFELKRQHAQAKGESVRV
jgi:hypothetical protein